MVEQPRAIREEFVNPKTGEREAKITPVLSDVEKLLREQREHIVTLDEIEQADDILEATVFVPEWSGSVRVRQFSKETEFALRKQATIGGELDRERLEMLLIVHGMVDPAVTEEHIGMLAAKSQRAVDRVLNKIVSLNAISQEEADKAVATFLDGR